MIILVECRTDVREAYISGFSREGVAAAAIKPEEIVEWCAGASQQDISVIEGFVVGLVGTPALLIRELRRASDRPLIALSERRSLEETLELFSQGVDDVIAKPVHVRELIARLRVINERRMPRANQSLVVQDIVIADGRDAIVRGAPLALPRRERRIIEYLVAGRGAWRTKAQIFSHVYGLFNDEYDETLVESHISRLRKRLRERLGRDVVESQRYLGYRLRLPVYEQLGADAPTSLEQGTNAQLESAITSAGDRNERLRHHGYEHIGDGGSK